MIQLLLNFWKHQTAKEKFFLILISILFSYAVFQGFTKAVYKYKYFKLAVEQRDMYQDSISVLNIKVKNLISKAQTQTKLIKSTSKKIDIKLKNDEKIIDASDVSNDELDSFLSKYENR